MEKQAVETELGHFVDAARLAFAGDLVSVVLFGSAAEDWLRATSDVNVVLVLRQVVPSALDTLRESLLVAQAAIRLRPMFLLESELDDAVAAFAVKFADIQRRHRVLHGADPFASLQIPRDAAIHRLRQVLLNQLLRLREELAARGGQPDRLVRAIADAAGPLRACAAELLVLEGEPPLPPREALQLVAGAPLAEISEAREQGTLPADAVPRVFRQLLTLCETLRTRAKGLR